VVVPPPIILVSGGLGAGSAQPDSGTSSGATVVTGTTTAQVSGDVDDGDSLTRFDERYLQIINDTGKPIQFWVQYRTKDENGAWVWIPVSPKQESRGVEFNIDAGATTYLQHLGKQLSASRIRCWFRSADGVQEEFRHKDLWLVPEVDNAGHHVYVAAEMETFPLRLAP
jgi:hypothetical protein